MNKTILSGIAFLSCVLAGLLFTMNWVYALVLIGGMGLFCVVLIDFKYGLYLTTFLLPFGYSLSLKGLKVTIYEIALTMTFFSFIIHRSAGDNFKQSKLPYRICIVAQVLLILLNTIFISVNPAGSFNYFFHYMEAILLFWITYRLVNRDQKEVARLLVCIISSAAIQAGIGIYQHFTGGLGATFVSYRGYLGILGLTSGRVIHAEGTFGAFNALGGFIGISLLLMLPMILDKGSPKYKLKVFLFFLLGAGFIFSYSRGALLGLIGGFIAIAHKRLPKKLYIIIFLLGAVIAGQFVTKAIHGKYIETVDYAGRKEIWKRPMDAIKQSPTTFLLGTGSNTYDKVVKYPASVAPQDRHLWFAHNQYILLWQEFGIIGLVIICALFGVVLIRNIRIIKSAFAPERFNLRFGIIGITLLMVVHGYFDHQFTLTHSRNLYFIILAMSEAA